MAVIARFRCHDVADYKTWRSVSLSPVYSSDPESPNYSFSQATPSGEIRLSITNPAAFEQFKVNKTYDITFVENEG